MTRKRFVKLMMSRGHTRNEINDYVNTLIESDDFSYQEAWDFIPITKYDWEKVEKIFEKFQKALDKSLKI